MPRMTFMVIERFRDGNTRRIAERFESNGRMMPEDVRYIASWLDRAGTTCFQIMEAPSQDALRPWQQRWEDLMRFEVIPVMSSADYWAAQG